MGAWRGAVTRLEQRLCLPIRPLLRQPVLRLGHRRTPGIGAVRSFPCQQRDDKPPSRRALPRAWFPAAWTAGTRWPSQNRSTGERRKLPSACCLLRRAHKPVWCGARDARRGPWRRPAASRYGGERLGHRLPSSHAAPAMPAPGEDDGTVRRSAWGVGGSAALALLNSHRARGTRQQPVALSKLDERHARTVGLASAW